MVTSMFLGCCFTVVITRGVCTPRTRYSRELNTQHIKAGISVQQIQEVNH